MRTRLGPRTLVALVELGAATTRAMSEDDFSTTLEPQVALKGGWGSATIGVESSVRGGGAPTWNGLVGAGLVGHLDFAGWWLSVGLGAASGSVMLPTGRRDDLFGTLSLGVGLHFTIDAWRAALGLCARPLLVSSTLQSAQRTHLGLEGGPALSIEWRVLGPLVVGLELEGLARTLMLEGSLPFSLGLRAALVTSFHL